MQRESPLRVLDAGAALAQLKEGRKQASKEASKEASKQASKKQASKTMNTQRKKKKRVTL